VNRYLLPALQAATIFAPIFVGLQRYCYLKNEAAMELIIQFDQMMYSPKSGPVTTAVELGRALDDVGVTPEELNDFLLNLERVATAHQSGLINTDIVCAHFKWDLNGALHDPKIVRFILDAKRTDPTVYDNVIDLAVDCNVSTNLSKCPLLSQAPPENDEKLLCR